MDHLDEMIVAGVVAKNIGRFQLIPVGIDIERAADAAQAARGREGRADFFGLGRAGALDGVGEHEDGVVGIGRGAAGHALVTGLITGDEAAGFRDVGLAGKIITIVREIGTSCRERVSSPV